VPDIERRSTAEIGGAGNRLSGYAAVFNSRSEDLGGFVETIKPNAFRRTLLEGGDVVALYDHEQRSILGRMSAGTLRLAEDDKGLRFDIDVPDTTAGRDVLISVKRGDIRGASFAFTTREQRWSNESGGVLRELLDVDLHDVTVTPRPAYPETSVARRALASRTRPVLRILAARYLETL
jgi:HK97 family phage prohead protease